jgi:hypothetical protein
MDRSISAYEDSAGAPFSNASDQGNSVQLAVIESARRRRLRRLRGRDDGLLARGLSPRVIAKVDSVLVRGGCGSNLYRSASRARPAGTCVTWCRAARRLPGRDPQDPGWRTTCCRPSPTASCLWTRMLTPPDRRPMVAGWYLLERPGESAASGPPTRRGAPRAHYGSPARMERAVGRRERRTQRRRPWFSRCSSTYATHARRRECRPGPGALL